MEMAPEIEISFIESMIKPMEFLTVLHIIYNIRKNKTSIELNTNPPPRKCDGGLFVSERFAPKCDAGQG